MSPHPSKGLSILNTIITLIKGRGFIDHVFG